MNTELLTHYWISLWREKKLITPIRQWLQGLLHFNKTEVPLQSCDNHVEVIVFIQLDKSLIKFAAPHVHTLAYNLNDCSWTVKEWVTFSKLYNRPITLCLLLPRSQSGHTAPAWSLSSALLPRVEPAHLYHSSSHSFAHHRLFACGINEVRLVNVEKSFPEGALTTNCMH